jgi:hypothetical protein
VPGPDAPGASDANIGLVRVRMPGHPEAEVFFQNADSSLVLATRADREGEANAYMAPGGFVTAVFRDPFSTSLFTWAGVEGGDDLLLLRNVPEVDPVTIFLSIPPDDPSTFFYQLVSSCGVNTINGAEVDVLPVELEDCPSSTVGMLVQTFRDDNASRFLYRDAVSIQHGEEVSIGGPYLDLETLTVHAINVPPQVMLPTARAALIGSGFELYVASNFAHSPAAPGTATSDVPMPLPESGTLAWQVDAVAESQLGATTAIAWGPVSHSVTVDFGAPLRRYTSAPHYVPTQHAVRWTEDATGRVADGVILALPWQHADTGESLIWRMLAPRSEDPVVQLPVLPLPDLRPGEDDVPNVLSSFIVDGGYASVRPYLLGQFGQVTPWPVRGDSGHVVVETLP